MSRPPRARGLKLLKTEINRMVFLSRPPRARGLKLSCLSFFKLKIYVAPPAGAWIETTKAARRNVAKVRRAPRGRVD